MKCEHCAREIDGDYAFCPYCGGAISSSDLDDLAEVVTLEVAGTTIELKLIRPGSFVFKQYVNGEQLEKKIYLSQPYYIGIYPVTQDQYQAVMGENPSAFPARFPKKTSYKKFSESLKSTLLSSHIPEINPYYLPVESVAWEEATRFCEKLSLDVRRCASLPRGAQVHLPSEAQWEYACRAGSTTEYFFGDDKSSLHIYAHFDISQSYIYTADFPYPKPDGPAMVGSYEPNSWGLYDMYGNVDEWCEDEHTFDAHAMPPDGTPFKDEWGGDNDHVLRGGGWHYPENLCSSSSSHWNEGVVRSSSTGFRICISLVAGDYEPVKE